MNYPEVIRWGRERLLQYNIDNAGYDARMLFEYVFGINIMDSVLQRTESWVEADTNLVGAYKTCIEMRSRHIPLQYITHTQNFYGYNFYVDESVLIPRYDTENLVYKIIQDYQDSKKKLNILDICTGTGCIAITLKLELDNCLVTATDISARALGISARNAGSLGADVRFVQSDLYSGLAVETYDIVVSNPPYVKSSIIDTLSEEVRCYEPRLALDGGDDGLHIYRQIVREVPKYLHKRGSLYLEIGQEQARAVSTLCKEVGFQYIEIIKDLSDLDRVLIARF